MNLIKPKLVDYNLIKFPKKKPTIIQTKISKQDNTKFYLNFFLILILLLGCYILYYRMKNKDKERIELEANILFLDEYVNSNLNNNKIDKNVINEEIKNEL